MKHLQTFESYHALNERVSDILYFAADTFSASEIMKDDAFQLSSAIGDTDSNVDIQYNKGKWFYLSCSREKFGGYARANNKDVTFVLDGRKLGFNNSSTNIDYWDAKSRYNDIVSTSQSREEGQKYYLNRVESEERILTDKPTIEPASKYVTEVHVYVDRLVSNLNDEHEDRKTNGARPLVEFERWSKKTGIPVYYYAGEDNRKAFQYHNKSKAKRSILDLDLGDLESLAKRETDSDKWSKEHPRTQSEYFLRDLRMLAGVYNATKFQDLDKETRKRAYDMGAYFNDIVSSAGIELRNTSRSGSDEEREATYKFLSDVFIPMMKKTKTRTLKEFIMKMKDKFRDMDTKYNDWRTNDFEGWITDDHTQGVIFADKEETDDDYKPTGKIIPGYDWVSTVAGPDNYKMIEATLQAYLDGDKKYAKYLDKISRKRIEGCIKAIKEKDYVYWKDYRK